MTIKFYDHQDGSIHFRAPAGGGNGLASIFDAPATKQQIAEHQKEYGEYLRLKEFGSVELDKVPSDVEGRNVYIADLERQLAEKTAQIEQLNAIIHDLRSRR